MAQTTFTLSKNCNTEVKVYDVYTFENRSKLPAGKRSIAAKLT